MIPVDYELGRQYQLERVHAANNHRLLRQVVACGHSHISQPLRNLPTARPVRARIVRVLAAATRRISTQVRSSLTAT
jgi:hypothetical protein